MISYYNKVSDVLGFKNVPIILDNIERSNDFWPSNCKGLYATLAMVTQLDFRN